MGEIVADASALVDLLLANELGQAVGRRVAGHDLHAPAHVDAEVLSALGRLHRAGDLDANDVETKLASLASAPVTRHAVNDLLLGAWARRHRLALDSRPAIRTRGRTLSFRCSRRSLIGWQDIGAASGQCDGSGLAHPAQAALRSERVPGWGSRGIGYGHRGMRRLSGTRDAGRGCGCGWSTDTGGFSVH